MIPLRNRCSCGYFSTGPHTITGGIAHDVNNLPTGSPELIEKRIKDGRVSGVDRFIGVAQAQCLLAFSRRQTLDPKPTDVNRLVPGTDDPIRRSVGPGVEADVVGAGGLWLTQIDPSQLTQSTRSPTLGALNRHGPVRNRHGSACPGHPSRHPPLWWQDNTLIITGTG
jgi:hypothetical protein